MKRELTLHDRWLFLQPALQLLGSVCGAVVENELHRPHSALKRLRDDDLLHKGLEIGKRFAHAAGAVDLPISDTQSGKQGPGSPPLVAGLLPLCLAPFRTPPPPFPLPTPP